jgi:hypothetical protein
MVEAYKTEYDKQIKAKAEKAYVYLIKANGKEKTKITSWWLGE